MTSVKNALEPIKKNETAKIDLFNCQFEIDQPLSHLTFDEQLGIDVPRSDGAVEEARTVVGGIGLEFDTDFSPFVI